MTNRVSSGCKYCDEGHRPLWNNVAGVVCYRHQISECQSVECTQSREIPGSIAVAVVEAVNYPQESAHKFNCASNPVNGSGTCDCQTPPTVETVNSPAHYGGADNPHEHWKCMVGSGLVNDGFLYNCTKYLWRTGKKGPALEDLRKALWYLLRRIEQEEGKF